MAKESADFQTGQGAGKPARQFRRMTLEEYVNLPESDHASRCELVRGTIVREPGVVFRHGRLQANLIWRLKNWTQRSGYGEVVGECDYVISEDPDTVRIPDASVLLRFVLSEDLFYGRVRGAPDIAIEILSPSNTPAEMREKIVDYLGAGALRVWIVDMKARTVSVYCPDGSMALFEDGDRLEDTEAPPGFYLEISTLFAL